MECGTVVPPFPAQHAAPHDKAVVNCRSPKRRRDAGCHTGETMTAITGDKTPVVVCAADRRYAMPLARLYMCGAATWPGAGTGAGSGYLLGRKLAGA